MRVNGTLMNYYFHCKRQCYLHGNRLNLEDNSEEVQIGKALHEEKAQNENTEIQLENIPPKFDLIDFIDGLSEQWNTVFFVRLFLGIKA